MNRSLWFSTIFLVALGTAVPSATAAPAVMPQKPAFATSQSLVPAAGHHPGFPVPAIPGAVGTGTGGPILPGAPGLPPCCPPVKCPPGCGPPGCPSPVLFIRVTGPVGTQATFFQPFPRPFDTPVTVGLRPGYTYRFKLSGLEKYPKLALFPTLQVIGTLQLPIPLNVASFPAPVLFTQDEIDRAMAGTYITKVIVLEDPEKATAVATEAERPLEFEAKSEREIMAEARARGRPMLVIRFGDMQVPDEVLAQAAIAGTALLPGDPVLGPPASPPNIPWACVPMFDPILGPKPNTEECMRDGGDCGPKVGIGPDHELHGLDPADTVAEYVDGCGRHKIAISNCVCVCVPRYIVVRTELAPVVYDNVLVPARTQLAFPPYLIRVKAPPVIKEQVEQPELVETRKRPSVIKDVAGYIVLEQAKHTGLVVGEQLGQVVIGVCEHKVEKPVCPLVICKCIDRKEAQIGDIVTFTLKYTNPGGKPITNVIVSDSLTTRLEYVAGSAKSDRDAVFTTQANEAGSVILRWQLSGPLLPGETGVIMFQAKIR